MRPYHQLLSTGFVAGLFLLLLNDFLLKPVFHNVLTGKVSDLAGLFIFPMFWSVLFPVYSKRIYFFTALFFVYWKSPASETFFQWWNAWSPLHLYRTVDLTDLVALFVLPFSYRYFIQETNIKTRTKPVLIMVLSAFAFVATSYDNSLDIKMEKTYSFDFSKDHLKTKLAHHPDLEDDYRGAVESVLKDPQQLKTYQVSVSDSALMREQILAQLMHDTLSLSFNDQSLALRYSVYVQMSGKGERSVLRVVEFRIPREEKEEEDKKKEALYKKQVPLRFEEKVIRKIRE